MNRLTVALCGLMLAAPLAWAQGTDAGKKAAPPSAAEQAQLQENLKVKMGQCSNQASRDGLKRGTAEFNRFMSRCLNG